MGSPRAPTHPDNAGQQSLAVIGRDVEPGGHRDQDIAPRNGLRIQPQCRSAASVVGALSLLREMTPVVWDVRVRS